MGQIIEHQISAEIILDVDLRFIDEIRQRLIDADNPSDLDSPAKASYAIDFFPPGTILFKDNYLHTNCPPAKKDI